MTINKMVVALLSILCASCVSKEKQKKRQKKRGQARIKSGPSLNAKKPN
jgi:hypothetical protein